METEQITWKPVATVRKYRGTDTTVEPYETIVSEGNILTDLGSHALWQRVTIGGATTSSWEGHLGESDATPWVGAYLAVGTGTTAAVSSDADLEATTTSVYYMHMSDGYPQFEDANSMDTAYASVDDPTKVVFFASFTTSVANFAWNEWGLVAVGTNPTENGANGSTITAEDTGGTFANRLFSRKIKAFGTKTSADTWTLAVTYTIGGQGGFS